VSQDNVGLAFDRAFKAGLPIASALGKHENDKMFSPSSRRLASARVRLARTIGSVDREPSL
jgi:hypothetical protein